ncbi:unnamed protein product [Miscanthus lutarioriparius]|uniref:BTB domain-containing protein n=1 Tax=Miscanthus lutarioriparius TaxID=422564 RepID=A0A811PUJ6_9POAL|nr:unnamed protein product [Miscanthus lutarioriparius]
MSLESCSALLGFIYGTIEQGQFWKHQLPLLAAANKYRIGDIKDCCEESLLEDISSANVLERLHVAWLYQLERLKKGCLTYLFVFGKIYDWAFADDDRQQEKRREEKTEKLEL